MEIHMNDISIMQYGIPPIVAIIGIIGVVLLAIVAIKLISKFISFAIEFLSFGISLYRLTRSKYVSQELREKAYPLIVDYIIIAAASLGIAIFIARNLAAIGQM